MFTACTCSPCCRGLDQNIRDPCLDERREAGEGAADKMGASEKGRVEQQQHEEEEEVEEGGEEGV